MATYRIRHKGDRLGLRLPYVCQGKREIKELFKRLSDDMKKHHVIECEGKFGKWSLISPGKALS